MGRLFWKIFLGLWLTLALTSGVVGLIAEQQQEKRLVQLADRAQNPRAMMDALFHALHFSGIEAAKSILDEQDKESRPILVIDSLGKELLNRPIPKKVLQRARNSTNRPKGSAPWTRKVRTPEGEPYIVFLAPRAPSQVNPPTLWRFWPRFLNSILGLSMVGATLLFSLILAWYMSRPIRHLREATNKLASGELSTRVMNQIGNRKGEISDLGRDFDHMAEHLQGVINAQKQLLSDVSHELRSPLARLQLAIELVRQKPERTESLLKRIYLESNRLNELVGQFLTLSRLEGDLSTESRTQVDIGSLLEDIIESLNFQATQEEKEVRLELRADSQLSGDAELLRRAFENVIGNAVKYTPPKSVVSVTLAKSDSTITVSVSDQGPGIDESKLKTIFEPFSRITNQDRFRDDPAQKSDERGFGLGLTIADRAIRRHHGTIRAFNLEEGGLSIVITLPATTQNQSISRGYK